MRRIVLGLTVAVTGLLLAGCPPTYPKCNSDEHCKDKGEVCVQGQCQECVADQNCKEGFVCQANKCVPKPECTDNAACGEGRICQNGKCATDPNAQQQRPEGTCAANEDCPSGQECQAGRCADSAAARLERCDWSPIEFGFNDYALTEDARSKLSQLAECMKGANVSLTLAGHADERGTEEYNLQLSNRRAASVQRYLTDLGVSNLRTVGYGETRPVDPASSEEAWAKNRRVELERQ